MNKTAAIKAMLDGHTVLDNDGFRWRYVAGGFEFTHHDNSELHWARDIDINDEADSGWVLCPEPRNI